MKDCNFSIINQHFRRLLLMAIAVVMTSIGVMARDFVITLDAGHGGHDAGAVGAKGNEKTITLAVAKRVGELIEENLKDVKVVFTRDKDFYVPLDGRASIANKASSDLFISVHVNSVDKRNRNAKTIEGCQVYTLGLHKTAENLAVAKRENAVMELEADHTEKYAGFDPNSLESDIVFELSQGKRLDQSIELADAIHSELVKTAGRSPKGVRQAGFWVLWATSMPAVLVELDFICNPNSESFLLSKDGQERCAIAIYNAVCAYVNTYGSQTVGHKMPTAHALTPSGKPADASRIAPQSEAAVSGPVFVDDSTEKPSRNASSKAAVSKVTSDIPEVDASKDTRYYIQIVASSSPLSASSSQLKGVRDVVYYKDGALYKYIVGNFSSERAAKRKLKRLSKQFPDCFIVKMQQGKRTGFIKP